MEAEYCDFCAENKIQEGEYACWECQAKLKVLMRSVSDLAPGSPSVSPSIEFKNVKFTSDYPGQAIIAIDGSGASGVQKPFQFDGQGKCIVCDELTTDTMVCTQCTDAVYLARNIKNASPTGSTDELVILLQDEGFLALMKFVASNSVKKYMEAEIEQFRES